MVLSDEYKKLAKQLENKSISKDEVYYEIMNKEKVALDAINAAAEKETIDRLNASIFYNRPLVDILSDYLNTWKHIFNDLVLEDGYLRPHIVFFKNDRKIYLGITFVILAFILFFVEISS